MKNNLFTIGLVVSSIIAGAQPVGNEWIDFNQEYIKLKIAEDGLYRVSGTELQEAGFDLSSVPASRVRLYRRGEEVAIRRGLNQDGVTLAFIEFWGERNDGTSDTELYKEDAQPHQEYNLFTDTAMYFFTWGTSSSNKRIITSTDNDKTGLTPETYHFARDSALQYSRYSIGRRFGPDNSFHETAYNIGEGWTGPRRGKNSSDQFSFTLENLVNNSVPIELDVVMIGENSQNHKVAVSVGPDPSNLTVIDEPEFEGYNRLYYRTTFNSDLLDDSNEMILRLTTVGFPGVSDNVSHAYIEVRYPQEFDLPFQENKIYRLKISTEGRSFLRVPTTEPENIRFYDITDPVNPLQLVKNNLTDRAELVVPGTSVERQVAAVSTTLSVPEISPVEWDQINTNVDYLIISHPGLRNADDGTDPVEEFAAYRSSQAGGNYSVEIADIHQVYDQFNYGDPSPLAIRRMIRSGFGDLQYVFIIGKGWNVSRDYFRKYSQDPGAFNNIPIQIPTFGTPGGDYPYSIGLDPNEPFVPEIPIGRLNAVTPEEVQGYLEKVIAFDGHSFDDLSKKNIIQLSGGQTATELIVFENYIVNFQRIAEGDFLGAQVLNQGKTTSAVFERFDISDEVNSGVGLVTLFGHSSSTITDIEIGFASDPGFGYNNTGDYPVLLVNGCNAGNIFTNTRTLGEDWTLTPEKGAIAFMSNSAFASSSSLRRFSELYYELAYANEESFGFSLGNILREVASQFYLRWGESDFSKVQILQTLLQGDPAIKPFAATQPDFSLLQEEIEADPFTGDRVLAQQDSFKLEFPVRNFGKTSPDSLSIAVSRVFPGGATSETIYRILSPKNESEITLTISNEGPEDPEGLNTFNIELDPAGDFDELDEANNTGSFELFIARSNTLNLFPINRAVVPSSEVSLIFQNANILANEQSYTLEVDTTAEFASAFKQSFILTGRGLFNRSMDLIEDGLTDGEIIYWRTRVQAPQTPEDSIWAESSFTFMEGSNKNWGILSTRQIPDADFSGINPDPVENEFSFQSTNNSLDIFVEGTEIYNYDNLDVIVDGDDLLVTSAPIDTVCRSNTFNAIALDKESSQLKRPIFFSGADEFNDLICGRLPQMIHNFTESNILGSNRYLDLFISNMEEGDKIVLFNFDSVAYSNWDDQLKTSLEEIGVDPADLEGLIDGQPLIISGEKGLQPGQATILKEDGTTLPVKQQALRLEQEIEGSFTSGSIQLEPIGPAKNWNELDFGFTEEDADSVEVAIELLGREGQTVIYNSNARSASLDISDIDASVYPFLQVTINVRDEVDQTPPSFDYLTLEYQEPPEGLAFSNAVPGEVLQEGQNISAQFGVVNLSQVSFEDSLSFTYQLQNEESGQIFSFSETIAPLDPGDSSIVEVSISSLEKVGENSLNEIGRASCRERVSFTV